ncbi:MAG: T9SS type A sorting domain-containing protein [Chlorobi bacterium]|nr:T9SS type A sorting domain-containing protein [Chlorobiota bacterium]MCI0715683.1 T9SS type A sorting domain-containing protein [Chlorobiota bacterium]
MKLYTDSTLNDYGLAKYSSSGNLIWNTYYNSPGNLGDNPVGFDVSEQGDVYITGYSVINFEEHITTVSFNTNGELQWAKVYNGGGIGDSPGDIIIDNSGNIIIVGATAINNNIAYALTIKYDYNGDTLWVKKFTQLPNYSRNEHVLIDNSNNIYIAGYYLTTLSDYLTLKYGTNGNLIWYTLYNSPQDYSDIGYILALDSGNNVYVVGSSYVFGASLNNNLVRINSNGVIQWGRVFTGIRSGNGQCESQPKGLAVSSDGNSIYYTTSCYGYGTLTDIVTLKYTSAGDSVWVKTYNGGVNAVANFPSSLKLDVNNDVYVTGTAYHQTSGDDFATIKYSPSGIQQWVATYNGIISNGGDYASDLVIDTTFNLFVTGRSRNASNNGSDALTLKYSQLIGIISQNNELPIDYKLYQNYPNPFNSTTIITYTLPVRTFVKINIYNSIGQLVKELVGTEQIAGYYSIAVDLNGLSSGLYFYTLYANNSIIDSKKFIFLK